MTTTYPPNAAVDTRIDADRYARDYAASIADPERFWGWLGNV